MWLNGSMLNEVGKRDSEVWWQVVMRIAVTGALYEVHAEQAVEQGIMAGQVSAGNIDGSRYLSERISILRPG